MDENMEVMTPADTTPAEPVTENTAGSAVDTSAETNAEGQPADTTPTEELAAAEAQPPAPVTVPVKFRHENRELSLEEATNYAQMGLLREAEQPMMDKLRMMAAGRGQSMEEFVNAWAQAEERAMLEQKLQITGGNREEAEKLLRVDLDDRRRVCETRQQQEREAERQAEQSLTDRLAGEFTELQEEYPEITDYSQVPQEVITDAIRTGRHLLDAYMRYSRRESKKIEQNRATQAAAAAASAGSQADTPPTGGTDPVIAAMLEGVRSVFN